MGTLYLDQRDTVIKAEQGALAIYVAGQRSGTVPMRMVERVVARSDVALSTSLIGTLADAGVGLVSFAGRRRDRVAILVGAPHNDASRRLAQAAAYLDARERMLWARDLVRAKLQSQLRLIRRLLKQRPDCRRVLTRAEQALTRGLPQVPAEPESLASLRGLEGAGTAAYFRGLVSVFPPTLGFAGRNRRPPRDPVNACLSLGYTLLHAEFVQACHAAGLDPLVGLYHEPQFGRASLAADLMEPLRVHIDEFVWGLMRDRHLEPAHFGQRGRGGDAVLLGKAGRRIFYTHWERRATALRRLARGIARETAGHFEDWYRRNRAPSAAKTKSSRDSQ